MATGLERTAVHVLVDRDARGEAVWCGAQYPTAAYAQAAGLSLDGYRDLLGRANQDLARQADEVYLLVAGLPWKLK